MRELLSSAVVFVILKTFFFLVYLDISLYLTYGWFWIGQLVLYDMYLRNLKRDRLEPEKLVARFCRLFLVVLRCCDVLIKLHVMVLLL